MHVLLKVVLVAYFASITTEARVNVSMYFEALCPDSMRFIARQLSPNYDKLKDLINLSVVPFGKAAHSFENGNWKFSCQHGPAECKGNIYLSCAWAKNSKELELPKTISLIACVMRPTKLGFAQRMQECAGRYNVTWSPISTCAESKEGEELLVGNGNKTLSFDPSFSFIPTIVFNEQFDQELQDIALVDFVAAVCRKIGDEKPEFCEGKENVQAGSPIRPGYFLFK